MSVSMQLSFHHLTGTGQLVSYISKKVEKLNRINDVNNVRVVIDIPNQHHGAVNDYAVLVLLEVPGRELVIRQHSTRLAKDGGIYSAVSNAFRSAERSLKEHFDKQDSARRHAQRVTVFSGLEPTIIDIGKGAENTV